MPYPHPRSITTYSPTDADWPEHIASLRRSSFEYHVTRRRSLVRFDLDPYHSEQQPRHRIVKPEPEMLRTSGRTYRIIAPAGDRRRPSRTHRRVSLVSESEQYLAFPGRSGLFSAARDDTYARIHARLRRINQHRIFLTTLLARTTHLSYKVGVEELFGHLAQDASRLESTLEEMGANMERGTEHGYYGSGRPFKVEGEWVKFI